MILISFCSEVLADKISFSGYGSTGAIFYARNFLNGANQLTYYQGKLQTDIKINKRLSAQLDIRGSSFTNHLELREVSMKMELFDYFNLKIGNLKKPFNEEILESRDELFTFDRSASSQYLSGLGYGSRAAAIMLYFDENKNKKPFFYYFSFYKDNSQNNGFCTRIGYRVSDINFAFSYMFNELDVQEGLSSQGFNIETFYNKKDWHWSLGGYYVDNIRSNALRMYKDNDEKVYSLAFQSSLAYEFDFKYRFLEKIEPVLKVGYIVQDTEYMDDRTWQVLTGVNIFIDKDFKLRLNADLTAMGNSFNDNYDLEGSSFIVDFMVRF